MAGKDKEAPKKRTKKLQLQQKRKDGEEWGGGKGIRAKDTRIFPNRKLKTKN